MPMDEMKLATAWDAELLGDAAADALPVRVAFLGFLHCLNSRCLKMHEGLTQSYLEGQKGLRGWNGFCGVSVNPQETSPQNPKTCVVINEIRNLLEKSLIGFLCGIPIALPL